jgi:integrase
VHQRLVAGVPDGASADLSLVRLPASAPVFPALGADLDKLRDVNAVTRTFQRQAAKLGFGHLRFHDLRGSHETMLLDAGVPVHTVAARCGHDPAVLLRAYAKRTASSDAKAAAVIGELAAKAAAGL